ncbi:hypothetical protein [Halalkalicoccus tibetensis]|uniref:Uncharacterized protein n=1 Tax=Halalkalicoccus tibetensis TaxID=175632 RepID=A0ABD5V4Y3_9EURY
MTPTVRIVAAASARSERYAAALDVERRHAAEWNPDAVDGSVDVVLFDPATVDRGTIAADRADRGWSYRAIPMDGDVEATARRVERAADGRRLERAIDGRFDAISRSVPEADRPSVSVPASLDPESFRELYEAL